MSTPQDTASRRPLWGWGLLLVTLLGGGAACLVWLSAAKVPTLPEVATEGLDPAIKAIINGALDEVRSAPRSGASWGKLGSVLMHYEFPEECRNAFEEAARRSPGDPRWPYLEGLTLMSTEPVAAATKLEAAVALSRGEPDAPLLRWSQFLAERGRDAEAERGYGRLRARHPGHAPALLGLARLRLQQGKTVEATNLLAGCLEDPHTAKAAYALWAGVLQRVGKSPEAAWAAVRSGELPADRPWPDPYWEEASAFRVGRKAMLEQGSALLDQGRWAEAAAILSKVTTEYPEDEEAWYLLGWGLNQQGRSAEAEPALREHLRRSPQSPRGGSQLAVALLRLNRPAEAVVVLQSALQVKPTWRELHFNLGYAWVQLGQEKEALGAFGQALALDPNHVPTYLALAELSLRQGDRAAASRFLEQAKGLEPANPRVLDLLRRVEESP
ncbi:MAG TPA: tetratricopeptide repeat protein [Verrucomicrobiae bacterium]|nr:tetratricopeptide repeat protein [Verrucomicrobiae bacterium]